MKNLLLSCLLLGALGCASVIHLPTVPALNTTFSTLLDDPASTATRNVSLPLDPTRYPPSPGFQISVITLNYREIDAGDLFWHILDNIVYLWREPTNQRIDGSLQFVDQKEPRLRTFVNPPYMPHKRMDLRTLGYVLMSIVTFLLDHGQDLGFGQWVRVREGGLTIEEAPLLLDIYIVPRNDLNGPVSSFVYHNDTNMTLAGNTSTQNPANAIIVAVEYTGTALSRGNIFQLIALATGGLVNRDAVAPCPEGRSQVSTPDGKARMLINVSGEYMTTFLAQGILDLLYCYSREKRWESSTATVRYDETLFAMITMEDVPVELDGPRNGGNDTDNESATA